MCKVWLSKSQLVSEVFHLLRSCCFESLGIQRTVSIGNAVTKYL